MTISELIEALDYPTAALYVDDAGRLRYIGPALAPDSPIRLAIADQRPDLEREPETIRGLTLEITIGKSGVLGDAVTYLERRKPAGVALLDHQSVRTA